ncbi:MAG: OmpA family protein [Acidaminobacteraceae bacterium]
MNYKNFDNENESNHDYWMSYSDLMAGLILILLLFLSISTFTFQESTERMNEQEEVINKQQELIEDIVGVKSKIILMLIQQFADSEMKIDVDEKTGSIRLESGVFFDVGNYQLKSNGKQFLDEFIPVYLEVLLDEDVSEYIGEVIIEGHTDTSGNYQYNLDLSQKRAFDVAKYIISDNFTSLDDSNKEKLKKIMTANGKSFSSPILDSKGDVDLSASRRVEFKFRLKDSDTIDELNKLLSEGDK